MDLQMWSQTYTGQEQNLHLSFQSHVNTGVAGISTMGSPCPDNGGTSLRVFLREEARSAAVSCEVKGREAVDKGWHEPERLDGPGCGSRSHALSPTHSHLAATPHSLSTSDKIRSSIRGSTPDISLSRSSSSLVQLLLLMSRYCDTCCGVQSFLWV